MAWLKGHGTMEQAVAFAALFWPHVSELDGRLYLGSQPPTDTLKDWATRSPETSPALVQSLLNRRFPAELLAVGGGEAAEAAMAQLLSQMWAARIAARWPGRAVTFATGQNDDGVWLSFWEE